MIPPSPILQTVNRASQLYRENCARQISASVTPIISSAFLLGNNLSNKYRIPPQSFQSYRQFSGMMSDIVGDNITDSIQTSVSQIIPSAQQLK